MFDSINIFILLTAVANLILGIVIFWSGRSAAANRLYSVNIFFILSWLVAMVVFRSAGEETKMAAVTLLYLAPIGIPSTFLHFTYLFPASDARTRRKVILAYASSIILALLVIPRGPIIRDVLIIPGEEKVILWGPLYVLYAIYFIGLFSFAFFRLFRNYLRGTPLVQRQVVFLLIGYSIAANLAMATNLILPWIGIFRFNWFGQILTLLMVLPTAYAMTQHGLFNVRLVATEVFAFAISFVLLFNVFIPAPRVFQVAKVILFAAVSFVGYLLIRSVLVEIRQREELQKLTLALETANEDLQRLDKARREFVSIASHQLRTPLSAIKGFVSMILEGSFGKVAAK
ncbi:MAG: hypothetical protein HYT46_00955, partial [Candidatus Vogelbacteria bacterium]|nr:hypothetical protein [Candidatus Vogelbacteria bacterium]